jgi:predicted phosphodiesterase
MKWTPEEESILIDNIGELSYDQIVSLIEKKYNANVPGFPVLRTKNAIRTKVFRDKILELDGNPYDQTWSNIIEISKEYRSTSTHLEKGLTTSRERKILTFSDLHIPFFLWEEMRTALKIHSDANVVVLNGDILDAYIFSTFSKSKRIAALKEYRSAFDLVKILSDNFESVVIVSGNHDYRTSRAVQKSGLEKEASQILRPDLLARIANGEELNQHAELIKKHPFSNVFYQKQESWYVRIGKTIFCHPSGFASGYPGATVNKLLDHFNNRMDNPLDFDSIVVGHTHKVYKGVVAGKLLIEQGAMAHKLPYQFKADLKFKNAMNGYGVIYQDSNGNTNFNDSHPIYLGSHLPVKKEIIV